MSQEDEPRRDPPRRPRAIRMVPQPLPGFEDPAERVPRPEGFRMRLDQPPVEIMPDPFAMEGLEIEPEERAVEIAQKRGIFRRSLLSWGGLFWSALGGLVSLGIGLWVTKLVDDLFARSATFGSIGLGLAALAVLALLVLSGREMIAIGRQRHIAKMHQDFAAAHARDDQARARVLVGDLASLYEKRPDTARARTDVLALRGEIVDGRDLVEIAERTLMAPLDEKAKAAVAGAAKRVSVVTTIAPRAIIDVAFVLIQAVRLIRQIADIYGGRPGFLGFLKLVRSVGAHLAITGGMAAGDSLLQQVVGHGIAAKISARLGEGVLNGLLTARIGVSAMAVCRPMPFTAEKTPNLRKVVPFLFRSEKDTGASEK
jgi:putative membrane protein